MTDRSGRAKRADRPRGDAGRPPSTPAGPRDLETETDIDAQLDAEEADHQAALEAEKADQEAELDAAAEELAESGVAHKIASGDREAVMASAPVAPPVRGRVPERAAATGHAAAPATIARRTETLPYVDDRFSKVWVALIAIAFAAVFAYAILGGKAGLLTRTPSPSPSPSATPTVSASPSAPASPSVSASPPASASP
jgi:hypothetical protein